MNGFLTYIFIVFFLAIFGWILLGRINNCKLRIIIKSGFLSFLLSPTFYFIDEHIILAQAWQVMLTAFTCDKENNYFFIGLAPILFLWLLGFLIGMGFYKVKHYKRTFTEP